MIPVLGAACSRREIIHLYRFKGEKYEWEGGGWGRVVAFGREGSGEGKYRRKAAI